MSSAKSAKRQQFGPKKFLATIGEGGKVVAFANKQKLTAREILPIQSSISNMERFGLWLCLKVAKRQR